MAPITNAGEYWQKALYSFEQYVKNENDTFTNEMRSQVDLIRTTFRLTQKILKANPQYTTTEAALNATQQADEYLRDIRPRHNDTLEYLNNFAAALLEINVEIMAAVRTPRPEREKRYNLRHPRTEEQITTQNSFAPLQNLEDNEENETAAPPLEPPKNKKRPRVRRVPPPEATTSAEHEVPPVTAAPSQPTRMPPITVRNEANFMALVKTLKPKLAHDFKTTSSRTGTRIYTQSKEDHQKVIDTLQQENQEFFTYQRRQDLPIKVVLRRLPNSLDPEELSEALQEAGYDILHVRQIVTHRGGEAIKNPLYIVSLPRTEKSASIYNLDRLLHMVVKVEAYKSARTVKQCFRCQAFGHTYVGCGLPTKCLICTGGHSHKDCPIREEANSDTTLLKCINCNGAGHTASNRSCPEFIKAQEKFQKTERHNEERKAVHTSPALFAPV
ncbi:hypothetical protein C0J52_24536 [Blattella germanica]|nr:hypothetical protein C0J52_24536 [Blattella germanica]